MVDFYAKDCGHCQALAPTWHEASRTWENTPEQAPVAWVQKECFGPGWADGADKDFCTENGVDSYPTLKLFHYKDGQMIEKFE
jgi:thiol-disulfide isomerase/thioredoxin